MPQLTFVLESLVCDGVDWYADVRIPGVGTITDLVVPGPCADEQAAEEALGDLVAERYEDWLRQRAAAN